MAMDVLDIDALADWKCGMIQGQHTH